MAILVPNDATRPAEIEAAAIVAGDLSEALDILIGPAAMSGRVLVARLDNLGDVLLAGPAVRAVRASGAEVTMLCGPNGRAAAELLPGVDEILEFRAPWIDPDGHAVDGARDRRAGRGGASPTLPTGGCPDQLPPVARCPSPCCCGWPASR